MSGEEGLVQRETTAALRERSLERLQVGFGRYVEAVASRSSWDRRDEMVNMTPFIDCARRLGHDPKTVLGRAATAGPTWLRELFDGFVRRTDVSLAAFGWELVDTPQGPAYRYD
jgi:hypothetical protein